MNTKEMRELDAWICENVLGLDASKYPIMHEQVDIDTRTISTYVEDLPTPTADAAAAMMVLEKCAEETTVMVYKSCGGRWFACDDYNDSDILVDSETLPLAICLFAKKLFDNQSSSK